MRELLGALAVFNTGFTGIDGATTTGITKAVRFFAATLFTAALFFNLRQCAAIARPARFEVIEIGFVAKTSLESRITGASGIAVFHAAIGEMQSVEMIAVDVPAI